MEAILRAIAHRPFPMPSTPWVMTQRWHDLLFAHWGMNPEDVRPLLPAVLRPYLDTFDGKAWVGVIPFWMSRVKMRALPPLPGLSTFPELNVRTYVTVYGKPGVYFFSLDAANLPAVYGARAGFNLPYFHASMSALVGARDEVRYESNRLHNPKPAEFAGTYSPQQAEVFTAAPGTVEEFLVERYCLYTASRWGRIMRADIHHLPWPLQRAQAHIEVNSMAAAHGIRLPETAPLLHFTKQLDVFIWWPVRAK